MAAKVKRNDEVQVLAGKDRGRRGTVRAVLPSAGRAVVTGILRNLTQRGLEGPSYDIDAAGLIVVGTRQICECLAGV